MSNKFSFDLCSIIRFIRIPLRSLLAWLLGVRLCSVSFNARSSFEIAVLPDVFCKDDDADEQEVSNLFP